MEEKIRIIVLVVGSLLAWNGYQERFAPDPTPTPVVPTPDNPTPTPVTPDGTIKVVIEPNRNFPPAPSNSSVLEASNPIRLALATSASRNDAFRIADTFRSWQELVQVDSRITTTQQFRNVYVEANAILLKKTALSKDYKNQLNTAMDATFRAAGLANEGPWNAQTKEAASVAFGAVSYQAYQAFITALN